MSSSTPKGNKDNAMTKVPRLTDNKKIGCDAVHKDVHAREHHL
jgi:hypothetical protein